MPCACAVLRIFITQCSMESFQHLCVSSIRIHREEFSTGFQEILGKIITLISSQKKIVIQIFFIFRAVDEFLPKSILDTIQSILSMVGSITLAATVNPYFLLPVFFLSIFFYIIQKIYLKTSKNVKRLEGIGELFSTITLNNTFKKSILFVCSKVTSIHTFIRYFKWTVFNSRI